MESLGLTKVFIHNY